MHKIPLKLRNATTDDLSFIYDSWLRSYKIADPWAKCMHKAIFFKGHKKVIDSILGISAVVVACNIDDDDQIYGYGVFQPAGNSFVICHYMYVKSPYRRFGIAKTIFHEATANHRSTLPVLASHGGIHFEKFLKDKWNLVFNPYILGQEFLSEVNMLEISQRYQS